MRALITGASGFLGARLVRRLSDGGHEVAVLPSPAFAAARLSGVRYKIAARAGETPVDVVYHLAGTPFDGSADHAGHERVIVGGAARLIAELRESPTPPPRRVVVAGSAAEYGSGHGWREEDAPGARPDSAFGEYKRAAWELFQASGLAAVELRVFTPFGEGEAASRLVPSAIAAALAGQPLRLRSTGCQTRDYCYAGDVIDAFVEAGLRPLEAGTVINIASGVERRVDDVARRVVALAGGRSDSVETGNEVPASLQQLSGNPERARELLGWQPRTGFDEGVRRAIAWFRQTKEMGKQAS